MQDALNAAAGDVEGMGAGTLTGPPTCRMAQPVAMSAQPQMTAAHTRRQPAPATGERRLLQRIGAAGARAFFCNSRMLARKLNSLCALELPASGAARPPGAPAASDGAGPRRRLFFAGLGRSGAAFGARRRTLRGPWRGPWHGPWRAAPGDASGVGSERAAAPMQARPATAHSAAASVATAARPRMQGVCPPHTLPSSPWATQASAAAAICACRSGGTAASRPAGRWSGGVIVGLKMRSPGSLYHDVEQ